MIRHNDNGVVFYTFNLPARHGFSTRLGGVSTGVYASMNLSFTRGDEPDHVRENLSRFCRAVGVAPEDVVTSAQTHGVHIHNATAADRGRCPHPDIDGLITDEPHVALMMLYADCVPLLFADARRHVVGAAHAGWRGTAAHIGARMVERMVSDYGCAREDIYAAVAPSIGPCCYEVDKDVAEAFEQCVSPRGEKSKRKYTVDLWEYNRRTLLDAGIQAEHIDMANLCTCCHVDELWSHRATGGQRGSLAALIEVDA